MSDDAKNKLHQLIDAIDDEAILQMVTDDIAYYTNNRDIVDDLDDEQLQELDEAIAEADRGETIDWSDFKKEMDEWKKG